MRSLLTQRTIHRKTAIIGISMVMTAIILLAEWYFTPLHEAENFVQDWFVSLGRKTPLDQRLVLIGIDQPTYQNEIRPEEARGDPVLAALRQSFPWSRKVWAELIRRLGNAGAKTIVLDIVFAAPTEDDPELGQALDQFHARVVIGSNFVINESGKSIVVPSTTLIPDRSGNPAALDDRVGYVNIWPDGDNVIRRARFRMTNAEAHDAANAPPEAILESLDARALTKFGQAQHLPAGTDSRRFRFTGSPGRAFTIYSVGDVLTPKIWERNFAHGDFFRDKLVLIGPTATIFHDFHHTPFAVDMAGPELHLNILNAALHDEFLREAPIPAEFALLVLVGVIAAVLGVLVVSPLPRLGALLLLNGGYLGAAFGLFNYANLVIPAVSPLLLLDFTGVAVLSYDFFIERLERAKLRHTMGLYFSPRVLEVVLADPGSMNPRHADVTLLLTDLRNSTPLAEKLGPKGMFELLNRAFEAQINAIMSEEGNLEHFLGDQFLSYWGAPQPQPDGPDRAERAALKLIVAMEALRDSLPTPVQELFGYGVALHSGRVLVGNKGSARRLDYGLVGDAVNEAARVESLSKLYGVRFFISRETFAQLSQQGTRRLVDRVIVKGKSQPVELYERENLCTAKNYLDLCRGYKTAYDEYFFGHFDAAQKQFDTLVAEFKDGPSRVLAARCAELALKPPTTWNGIWKMEEK